MSDYAKQIIEIAQSNMSRNALNRWDAFKLPPPDKGIDRLLNRLADVKARPRPETSDKVFGRRS